MTERCATAALACALVLAGAAEARADRMIVLPLAHAGGDADVDAAIRSEAHAAVAGELAREGVEVATGARAAAPRGCADAECLAPVLARAGAAAAVHLTFWRPTAERGAQVVVSVIDASGTVYGGSAIVEEAGAAEAARFALREALAKRALGPGPWLSIRGEPLGARFTVDGGEEALVPGRVRVEPGIHQVVVSLDGYATETRTVRVSDRVDAETVVDVRLVREGEDRTGGVGDGSGNGGAGDGVGAGGSVGPRGDGGGGRAILGPLALAGAGAIAVGVGIVRLALGESVEQRGEGWVIERPASGAIAAWMIGGAVAMGAGLLWYLLSGGDDDARAQAVLVPSPNGVSIAW